MHRGHWFAPVLTCLVAKDPERTRRIPQRFLWEIARHREFDHMVSGESTKKEYESCIALV
jgi:hypothetical protein